jgi:hypothetical protein
VNEVRKIARESQGSRVKGQGSRVKALKVRSGSTLSTVLLIHFDVRTVTESRRLLRFFCNSKFSNRSEQFIRNPNFRRGGVGSSSPQLILPARRIVTCQHQSGKRIGGRSTFHSSSSTQNATTQPYPPRSQATVFVSPWVAKLPNQASIQNLWMTVSIPRSNEKGVNR